MGKTRGRKDRDYANESSKLYLQEPCLERKIQEDELMSITEVPEGLDPNEWLALHTIGFFEHINLLYGTVSEFCNLSTCPDMVAPSNSSACFLHPYNYPQYQTLPMGHHSHPHPCFLPFPSPFSDGSWTASLHVG